MYTWQPVAGMTGVRAHGVGWSEDGPQRDGYLSRVSFAVILFMRSIFVFYERVRGKEAERQGSGPPKKQSAQIELNR